MYQTLDNSNFCGKCGDRLQFMMAENRHACANPNCEVNKLHWDDLRTHGEHSAVNDGGDGAGTVVLSDTLRKPIRLPTRDELLADARCGHWQPIRTLAVDKPEPVLLTRRTQTGHWLLERKYPDPANGHLHSFVYGHAATHWMPDTVGSPVS